MTFSSAQIEMATKNTPMFQGIEPASATSPFAVAKRKRSALTTPVVFKTFELVNAHALKLMVANLEHPDMPTCVTGAWYVGGKKRDGADLLRKMLRKLNTDGELPCDFARTARCEQQFGRIYAYGAVSLQGIGRQVRHTLGQGVYMDLDAVNCQFALLLQYFDRLTDSPPHELLREYVSDRARWLGAIMDATGYKRDQAKKVITASLFGGRETHRDAALDACKLGNVLPDYLDAFVEREIVGYCEYFEAKRATDGPDLLAVQEYIASQAPRPRAVRAGARIMSSYLGHLESLCLFAGHDFCIASGLEMRSWVPIHDGFMVPIAEMERRGFVVDGAACPAFLARLQVHIAAAEGYSLEFVEKPLDEAVDLSAFTLPETPVGLVEVAGIRDLIIKSRGNWTYERTKVAFEAFVYKLRLHGGFQELLPNGALHTYKTRLILQDAMQTVRYTHLVTKTDKRGVEKEVVVMEEFVPVWLNDPYNRSYERVMFAPPFSSTPLLDGDVNIWEGVQAQRMLKSGVAPTPGGESGFREHVRALCGDDATAEYLEMWYAQIVQQPGVKAGISVCLIGEQGCGKSMLADNFSRRLLGNGLFKYTASAGRDVFGRFSNLRHHTLLINMDESVAVTMQKNADALKAMVTQPTYQIELKGVDSVEETCYTRFIVSTNNSDGGVAAQGEARRDFPISCMSTLVNNRDYFDKFGEWMEDDGNIVATYQHLMGLDVVGFDFTCKPRGKGMDEHSFKATPAAVKFLVCSKIGCNPDPVAGLEREWPGGIRSAADLREDINAWVGAVTLQNKDTDLRPVGPRSLTTGLDYLIKSGAVEMHRNNGLVYKFNWEAVVARLARYSEMYDMY